MDSTPEASKPLTSYRRCISVMLDGDEINRLQHEARDQAPPMLFRDYLRKLLGCKAVPRGRPRKVAGHPVNRAGFFEAALESLESGRCGTSEDEIAEQIDLIQSIQPSWVPDPKAWYSRAPKRKPRKR